MLREETAITRYSPRNSAANALSVSVALANAIPIRQNAGGPQLFIKHATDVGGRIADRPAAWLVCDDVITMFITGAINALSVTNAIHVDAAAVFNEASTIVATDLPFTTHSANRLARLADIALFSGSIAGLSCSARLYLLKGCQIGTATLEALSFTNDGVFFASGATTQARFIITQGRGRTFFKRDKSGTVIAAAFQR